MKKVKWEVKLNEVRELRRKGVSLLHKRVSLLVECFEDTEFHSWCEQNHVNEYDYLDAELSDVNASFVTMQAVLRAVPNCSDWQSRGVQALIAEAISKEAKPKGSSEKISWKERALKAERECEQLRAELSAMKKALEFSGRATVAA